MPIPHPQRETRIGLLTEGNQILDLSDAGVDNLTSLLEAEGVPDQLDAFSRQRLAPSSLNQIQLLSPIERQEVWAAGALKAEREALLNSEGRTTLFETVYTVKS